MNRTALLAATLTLAACTFDAPVSSTAIATATIVPAQRSALPASYYFAPDLLALHRDASGGPCTYPITIGPAIVDSLAAVTAAAFPAGANRTQTAAPAAERHLMFSLDSFTPAVALDPRWFSVGATGTIDLALRVVVQDAAGATLWNGLIEGHGVAQGESAGGCAEGGRMLSRAANEAVRRLSEDYAATVINSGQI